MRIVLVSLFLVFSGTADVARAQQCVAPPSGLLAWYRGERNADDAAGFHNGTPIAQSVFVAGKVGEAFRTDGEDDGYVTDTTSAEQRGLRDTFSYELWAKPSAALGACSQAPSNNCSGSNLRWAIFPTHGDNSGPGGEFGQAVGIGVGIGTNGVCVGGHAAFEVSCLARIDTPISDWVHVVAVIENKQPRIYLNGVLVHTGVASSRQFVHASWEVFGSGLSLGRFAGDLDEVSLYDRALDDAEIAALFAAGSAGKCSDVCAAASDDAWQLAAITDHGALRPGSAAQDAFGATAGLPEPGNVLFADGQPDGSVSHLEWQTESPINLRGFSLSALHDSATITDRAMRRIRLQARNPGGSFVTLFDGAIVVPYGPNARELRRCVDLRPMRAQQFRAEFTQDGAATFSGVRLEELDGFGLPDAVFRDGFEVP